MKCMIIPAILEKNKKEFMQSLRKVRFAPLVQIDFMDGKFVKQKSISLSEIPNLKKFKNKYEAHLMVKNPERWISKLNKKGVSKIIFHREIKSKKIKSLIEKIKQLKMQVYIAINPSTPIDKIKKYIDIIDGVLVMTVVPGKQGQKFIKKMTHKIKWLRKLKNNLNIQVDGGVNDKNIRLIKKNGANLISVGSFVVKNKNPKDAYDRLLRIINKKY